MYEIFRQLLKAKGLTVADVSKGTGISQSTLSNWKKRNIPDAYVMKMGGWQTDYVMKRHYRATLSDVEKKEQDKLSTHFSKML